MNREHLLRPGATALFKWGYGYPLVEWAKAYGAPGMKYGVCRLTVSVFDYFENGIADTISVVMQARPLEPVSSRSGHWRLTDATPTGISVYPAKRTYRAELPPLRSCSSSHSRPPPAYVALFISMTARAVSVAVRC